MRNRPPFKNKEAGATSVSSAPACGTCIQRIISVSRAAKISQIFFRRTQRPRFGRSPSRSLRSPFGLPGGRPGVAGRDGRQFTEKKLHYEVSRGPQVRADTSCRASKPSPFSPAHLFFFSSALPFFPPLAGKNGWGSWIRTRTDRSRVCRATVTLIPSPRYECRGPRGSPHALDRTLDSINCNPMASSPCRDPIRSMSRPMCS